jgi:hypothetical protein
MHKTKCQKMKKVRKPMNNGKRSLNFQYQKSDKLKINLRLVKRNKTGFKEESLDMVGEKQNNQDLKDQISN